MTAHLEVPDREGPFSGVAPTFGGRIRIVARPGPLDVNLQKHPEQMAIRANRGQA